jgi:hypothetical protein
MMNWKGFGRKWSWLNRRTILAFIWRDQEKPKKKKKKISKSGVHFQLPIASTDSACSAFNIHTEKMQGYLLNIQAFA